MNRVTIENSVVFWDPDLWRVNPNLGISVVEMPTNQQSHFRNAVGDLWSNSETARGWINEIISHGPFRMSSESTLGAHFNKATRYDFDGDEEYETTPAFISINPDLRLWAFAKDGTIFQIDDRIVIGHELAHWMAGTEDVGKAVTEQMMNSANFDFTGNTVRLEQLISGELGINKTRVSYDGAIFEDYSTSPDGSLHDTSRLQYIDKDRDYADGEVDIVRLGDSITLDDRMDNSHRLEDNNMLAFGFTGNDQIIGGSSRNWIYGGIGNDSLIGGQGRDRLEGEDGNDFLMDLASDQYSNVINGGAGNDIIVAANSAIDPGEGSDTIWLPFDCQNVSISNADKNDRLFLDGWEVKGGKHAMVDLEFDEYGAFLDFVEIDQRGLTYMTNYTGNILFIQTRSGGVITVNNFRDGVLGIHLDETQESVSYGEDDQGNMVVTDCSLAFSDGALDNIINTVVELPVFQESWTAGPVLQPVDPLAF